jgi:hypothetical protein
MQTILSYSVIHVSHSCFSLCLWDYLTDLFNMIYGTVRLKDKETTSEALGFRVSGMQVSYIKFTELFLYLTPSC